MTPASPLHIAERIVEAVLAQKLAPGDRLGEQELADNFAVSRTVVREAMVQLQARGFVQVQPRKGWFIVQPSADEARDAFAARRDGHVPPAPGERDHPLRPGTVRGDPHDARGRRA